MENLIAVTPTKSFDRMLHRKAEVSARYKGLLPKRIFPEALKCVWIGILLIVFVNEVQAQPAKQTNNASKVPTQESILYKAHYWADTKGEGGLAKAMKNPKNEEVKIVKSDKAFKVTLGTIVYNYVIVSSQPFSEYRMDYSVTLNGSNNVLTIAILPDGKTAIGIEGIWMVPDAEKIVKPQLQMQPAISEQPAKLEYKITSEKWFDNGKLLRNEVIDLVVTQVGDTLITSIPILSGRFHTKYKVIDSDLQFPTGMAAELYGTPALDFDLFDVVNMSRLHIVIGGEKQDRLSIIVD